MDGLLFWTYLINAVLLINHEIDSAYWQEWKLYRIPGDVTVSLVLHIPLLFLILLGLLLVYEGMFSGLVLSLILGFGGIFAFSIHTYFIRKGGEEFDTLASRVLLIATLVVSIF
jgi:hypothetical protein